MRITAIALAIILHVFLFGCAKICPKCEGIGEISGTCPICNGTGEVKAKCPDCEGKGYIEHSCDNCVGEGDIKCTYSKMYRCGIINDYTYKTECRGGRLIVTGSGENCVSATQYKNAKCPECGGDGIVTCNKCWGRGIYHEECPRCHGKGEAFIECSNCSGTCKVQEKCPECKGKGKI